MKKINLIERLWTDSHEKQTPQRLKRYAGMLLMLLSLGMGQMWAGNIYKITGNGPGWGTWVDMTVSSDGYYEYYTSSSGNCECKINTSATYDNAYGEYYRDNGFNRTDIANGKGGTWTDGNHNANYWYNDGSYFLIIYYANTSINTTSSPKICASTFLPDDSPVAPWICRSTGGGSKGTKTVGDKLNGGNEWNYTYTTGGGWSTATDVQVYIGISPSYYKTVNAVYVSDGSNGNKNVSANIGNVTFDKSGIWYAVGKYTAGGATAYTTTNSTWTNNTTLSFGSNSEPYWTVNPPALSSFTITPTGAVAGSGTSGDPYIVPYGGDLTLVSSGGTKAVTDANSSVQFSTDDSSYGTATANTTKTISNVTSTSATYVNLYAKCYNSTASLSGTVKTQAIYYRAAALNTITLNKGTDGTSNGTMTIREYATAYTSYTPAEKTDWSLKGYYTAASDGTQIIEDDGSLISNKSGYTNSSGQWIGGTTTLYAQWKQTYSVTYDDNGKTGGGAAPTDATEYDKNATVTVKTNANTMTKEYYTFDGWNTKADGTGTHYDTGATFSITNNVKLYAEWRPNLPNSNDLKIDGKLFSDWDQCISMTKTIDETNHKQYTYSGYWWEDISDKEFVFKHNGCNDFLKAKSHIMDLVTATGCTVASSGSSYYNFQVTTDGPKLITVTVDFYITNHSSVPNEIAIAVTAETPSSGYYLKHPWNGGTWCWKKLTNESGNIYILREKYGNNGCNYAYYNGSSASTGWKEGNNCTKHYTGSISSGDSCLFVYNSSNNNIDIYKLYPVTFHINGATTGTAPGATSALTNGTINFPYQRATTVPSNAGSLDKTGYDFACWNANSSGTGTDYAGGSGKYTLNSSSATLYAKWTPEIYTVPLNANQDGGTNGTAQVTYLGTSLSSITAPTYTGYHVDGYYKESGKTNLVANSAGSFGSRTVSDRLSSGTWICTTNNTPLYTKWAANTYTIAFDANDAQYVGTATGSTASVDATYDQNVTLTANGFSRTGYTFAGWATTPTGAVTYSNSQTLTKPNLTSDNGETVTLYAKWTEDMHTVTLNSSVSGGHVEIGGETVTSTSAGIATASPTITAVADSGYYFTGWTGDINSGVTLASGSTSTASITIRATADSKSITANFDKRWIIAGDWLKDGGGSWVMTNKMDVSKLSGTTFATKRIDGLTANTDYDFKLYDLTGDTHWVGFASDGEIFEYGEDSVLVNTYPGYNIKLKTAAQGNYYFYYNLKTHKLNISFPASRQVTMGTRTEKDGITSAYTGGTISAVDNSSNVITNGLYVASDASITFTATPKSGYIWRGWYNSSGCTGEPVSMDRVHTDYSVTVGFQRYALFEEALYTVKVHRSDVIETTVKVGVDTKPAITASTAPTGKVFDRWVTTGSATVADPYSSTTTITGATDNVSTVTATFKDLPKIYIDLTSATDWRPSNLYAYFYKGSCWDGSHGASATTNIIAGQYTMTKIDDTNIWYCAYDPTSGSFSGKTITGVAFSDQSQNSGTFWDCTVAYRNDFSSCMNMFVVTDNDYTKYDNHNCAYRNTNAIAGDAGKGYWRKYEEKNSGFYLNNLPGGSVEFTNEDGGNTYSARVNLDANTTYYFYLGGCNGWNWSNNNGSYPFNYSNPTRMVQPYGDVSSDGLRCKLTTTAAGYYTFTLTPQNTRNVQVSVAFPVAANDYRAVYNNAASSPTVSRPSNIIKNDQNSGTISLWLNKGTNYISFQKAAVAVGGAVSWSACGSQQTVSDVPEAGIYNMTLTRDGSTYTVSTPEKYEGGLYIRTDCAPGKWADYTENKLDENTFNFSATDPNTFDYYYCKWINDAGTNVRCVIANDINVALSDTLKSETILGGGETLPEGANVRFSYNSVTNTLKRSYLTGASTDVFLNIIPDNAETVYKTDGTTDMYGSAAAKNKFSDLGNWVYELEVKVKPNATAAVKANYNSTSQALIAAETKLVGGTGSDLYSIRLVYDFRTNYLMSAWMPNDDDITTSISLNSDMMIVRRGQNYAKQLSFTGGSLSNVKRAYGVFEFNKSEMVNNMNSWSDGGTTYGLCMYYFSLPFDVNVSDIFGVGTMGDDWRIQFYNGKKRAEKGWFAGDGTTTFWEDVPADTVLYAYEGYLLMLNRSHFNNGSHAVWTNVTTNAYLYFPSVAPVAALKDNVMEITVPSHECKIDRFFNQDSLTYYNKETKTWGKGARNHKYVDSHWNLMGTPLFEDATAGALNACKVTIGDADSTLNYIYEWVPSTNSLSARQVLNTSFEFKPMYAYMVQYAGKVTFTGASITPASIAARRTSENKQYTIDLLLTKEDRFAGRTYVELRENAVDSFMLNEDMYMMKGSKVGDIYTLAGGYEVAANVLTVNSHVVPVSVDTKSAGTYTISMPSNFSGTVTLVDKFANTRTNLAIEDYEIYLEKGTILDRFELEININNVPTAIDGVSGGSLKDGKAHKFIENGNMFILNEGVIYDARGNRVK